ncbi:hypothetical protein [Tsukamurella soli]
MTEDGYRVEEHHGRWRWVGDNHGPLHGRSGTTKFTEGEALDAARSELDDVRDIGSRRRFAGTTGEFVAVYQDGDDERRVRYTDYEALAHALLERRERARHLTPQQPESKLAEVVRIAPDDGSEHRVDIDHLLRDVDRHSESD